MTTSISHMVCQPGRHPTTVAVLWSIRLPLFTLYHMGPSYCKGSATPFLLLYPHLPIMFLSSLYRPVLWPLSIAVILVFIMFSYFVDEFLRLLIFPPYRLFSRFVLLLFILLYFLHFLPLFRLCIWLLNRPALRPSLIYNTLACHSALHPRFRDPFPPLSLCHPNC